MSVYTSINISVEKAQDIVYKAMREEEFLKDFANMVLKRKTLYNIYMLVQKGDMRNEDDKLEGYEL